MKLGKEVRQKKKTVRNIHLTESNGTYTLFLHVLEQKQKPWQILMYNISQQIKFTGFKDQRDKCKRKVLYPSENTVKVSALQHVALKNFYFLLVLSVPH